MSWNQGNGNGYGQPEDVYGRLNNTKEIGGARFPFIEGSGKYALCTLEEFQHTGDGPSARALLKVLASDKHPPGSYVVKIWKLVKPPFKPGMTTDADMFADFCRKLKGVPVGYPIGNDIRVLMKERPNDHLARGTVIEASGVPKDYVKRDGTKAVWTNIYWISVPQSPQDIVAMRQRLEAEGVPSTGGPAPQAQPQTQYPPQTQMQQPAGMPWAGGQPAAAPQGVPAGGFLANVPTNGQGNGNGGQGGW